MNLFFFFTRTISVNPRGQLLPNLCHNLRPCLPRDTVDPTLLSAAVFCNSSDSQTGTQTDRQRDRWTGEVRVHGVSVRRLSSEGPVSNYLHTVGVNVCYSLLAGWQSAV